MRTAAALGAFILVLSSCGSSHTGANSHPGLTPAASDLVTKSGAYDKDQAYLSLVEQVFTRECMTAKGFRYYLSPPKTTTQSGPQASTVAQRQVDGYGLYALYLAAGSSTSPSSGTTGTDVPRNDLYVRSLPAGQQEAYSAALLGGAGDRGSLHLPAGGDFGYPTKGCVADSRSRLYGGLATWAQLEALPQMIDLDISSRVSSDPAYTAAVRLWSGCMAAKGYQYAQPSDAVDDVSGRYRAGGATKAMKQQEITTAVADSQCADQAQLQSVAAATELRYTKRLTADQERLLLTLAEFRAGAVGRAKSLLAHGAGSSGPTS